MSRLGRQDWIDEGLRTLMRSGVEAVRVEPLAKALKVTKGSFYWHFKDRAGLLDALREAWCQRATEAIISDVEGQGGDARQRLTHLLERVAHANGRLESAMRSWAATDAETASVLAAVDRSRMGYLERLMLDIGLTEPEARGRARLCYHAFVGQFVVADERKPEARLTEWLEVVLPLVAGPPA